MKNFHVICEIVSTEGKLITKYFFVDRFNVVTNENISWTKFIKDATRLTEQQAIKCHSYIENRNKDKNPRYYKLMYGVRYTYREVIYV